MWHRTFPRFCGRFYFSRITVHGASHLPVAGPVLWLGLHRNGAVDGFVYSAALRRPMVYLISTQLRKNFLARIFFGGIAVARTNDDADRSANRDALTRCVEWLRRGGELFVFPEGTSALGPRPLPFKAGAAQFALDWLEGGGSPAGLRVFPVGIHYDCAWAFRSRVEVAVGPSVDIALPPGLAALGRLRELKRRMSTALEAMGASFADAAAQREAESVASLAALALGCARWPILKACERGEMAPALQAWRVLDGSAAATRAARYHGVPLVACGVGVREAAELMLLAPLVLAGIAVNALPWLVAWWAGRKFPDGTNVISLWKCLVGLPLFALWASLMVALPAAVGHAGLAAGYVVLTTLAWAGYDGMKQRAVAVWNRWFHPALREPFLSVIAHCRVTDEPRR